jgi:hypothetical protein
VIHRIAHHVRERIAQPFKDGLVDFNLAAFQLQLRIFA